ncbi:MAG: CBS domain-containing protein [Actinobacteria bacterium]|nr:MAG: CBS domain-containing protein [Actinomycetota bacterium]
MQVRDIMHTDVKTTSPSDTFEQVASVLRENGISSVIVMDAGTLAGIVTERTWSTSSPTAATREPPPSPSACRPTSTPSIPRRTSPRRPITWPA